MTTVIILGHGVDPFPSMARLIPGNVQPVMLCMKKYRKWIKNMHTENVFFTYSSSWENGTAWDDRRKRKTTETERDKTTRWRCNISLVILFYTYTSIVCIHCVVYICKLSHNIAFKLLEFRLFYFQWKKKKKRKYWWTWSGDSYFHFLSFQKQLPVKRSIHNTINWDDEGKKVISRNNVSIDYLIFFLINLL